MEVVQEQVSIPADCSRLVELRGIIRRLCAQFQIRPNTARRLVLAVDEAVSNIIEHSRVTPGSSIDVTVDINEEGIVAEIRDHGVDFDPRRHRRPAPRALARSKRGFGLYLIHLITDGVQYERTAEGTNVLKLTIDGR